MEWATKADIEPIITIYEQVFDASRSFWTFYFKSCPEALRTLLVRREGQIASVLTLLPLTAHTPRGELCGSYVFAAATHPAFEGQGLMTALLAESAKHAGDFRVLVPSEPSLFSFYEKRGFRVLNSFDYRPCTPGARQREDLIYQASLQAEKRLQALQRQHTAFFTWPQSVLEVASYPHPAGEGCYYVGNDYMVTTKKGNKLYIYETSDEAAIASNAAHICRTFGVDGLLFRTAGSTPYAMIDSISPLQNIYFNLGLE